MGSINNLKGTALNILLKEAFSYVENNMYNGYVALAKANSRIRNTTSPVNFFMYNGNIYPSRTANGVSLKKIPVTSLSLHFSLIDEFSTIQQLESNAGYNSVKNFFSSVLGNSFNNIVLEEFLPTVLLSKLKKDLSEEEYKAINFGSMDNKSTEPIEVTKENIQNIHEHYGNAITLLRNLLMERFLLQE